MRTFAKAALGVAVVALAASVSLAQQPPRPGGGGFGGMGMDGPMLLLNKSVQDELKLTDDQKADLKKIGDKRDEAARKAMQDAGGDFSKIQEVMKPIMEDATKALAKPVESLKPDQAKRFKQIQVQVKGIRAFSDEDTLKSLKLTDKQKEEIAAELKDLKKDSEELFKDLPRGDREKRQEAFKKAAEMTKATTDKITGTLTDDQKKAWKDMAGEKFEIKTEIPGGGPGGVKKDKGF